MGRRRILIEALDGSLMLVSLEYRIGTNDWIKERAKVRNRERLQTVRKKLTVGTYNLSLEER
jgi:hypothetical protein